MKEFPDLKTTRCHLVQATLADAEAIFEIVNTLECRMNMPEFYSLFHHKERIRHLIQVFSEYWQLPTKDLVQFGELALAYKGIPMQFLQCREE